jgi:hypothetical protein
MSIDNLKLLGGHCRDLGIKQVDQILVFMDTRTHYANCLSLLVYLPFISILIEHSHGFTPELNHRYAACTYIPGMPRLAHCQLILNVDRVLAGRATKLDQVGEGDGLAVVKVTRGWSIGLSP